MEGAAAIMGNSVAQWRAVYAPTLKRRRAQEAADNCFTPRRVLVPGLPAPPEYESDREEEDEDRMENEREYRGGEGLGEEEGAEDLGEDYEEEA